MLYIAIKYIYSGLFIEMLRAIGEQKPETEELAVDSHQQDNNNLEDVAANFNAKANFQRAVFAFQKPFSFLSSVGGNKTSLKEITSGSSQKETSIEFTATTEIKLYNNIDIDKSIRSQLFKRPASSANQQRPQTVSVAMNQMTRLGTNSASERKGIGALANTDLGSMANLFYSEETKPGKQRPMTAQPLK
jgi:hypothetical protein